MQAKHFIRIMCAVAISMPILGVREFAGSAAADVNGDSRVNVLDLQAILAKALHSGNTSVLDFQRALREVQFGKHDREIPPSKPCGPDVCVFAYQTGRMADLVNRDFETAATVVLPPALSEPGEHPQRCIIPATTGRYLFILTPNAPPFCA